MQTGRIVFLVVAIASIITAFAFARSRKPASKLPSMQALTSPGATKIARSQDIIKNALGEVQMLQT